MVTFDLDLSGRNLRPPQIPELIIEGVLLSDLRGGNSPTQFSAVLDIACPHCVTPVSMLEFLEPEVVGRIDVGSFKDLKDPVTEEELYKIQLFIPYEKPIVAYTIFVPSSLLIIGRSALRDHNLSINFATGKGQLSRVP
jgi:hypothetical protein